MELSNKNVIFEYLILTTKKKDSTMNSFVSNPNQSERSAKFFSTDITKNDLVTFEDIEHAVSLVNEMIVNEYPNGSQGNLVWNRLKDSIFELIGNVKDSENEISELRNYISEIEQEN